MYLRTQCRNEGLKIKIHKSTKPEHLYYEKKKVKMHKIRHSHTASAVGILEKVGPKVRSSKGANK